MSCYDMIWLMDGRVNELLWNGLFDDRLGKWASMKWIDTDDWLEAPTLSYNIRDYLSPSTTIHTC